MNKRHVKPFGVSTGMPESSTVNAKIPRPASTIKQGRTMLRSASFRAVTLMAFFGAVSLGGIGEHHFAHAGQNDDEYRLSSLRVFNRVVLLVKEQYVEPARIKPKTMLVSAMESVEQKVPEVLVERVNDNVLGLVVGTQRKEYDISDISSLWELSFKLRDIFRFLETRISPDVDRKEVEYAVINGMLSKLDPHSILLEPRSSQEMKLSTKGEFGGLGIVISIRDGWLTVISPIDGTPASRAGILAQDRIVKINNESTINMGLDEAVERLRGKPNTQVAIWITRKGMDEPKEVRITRAIIKVDSVTHHLMSDGVGYVKVKQFQGRTTEDVKTAITKMQKTAKGKLSGLILDLRNNPGGLLDQSVEMSDLFLEDGVIVVTQEGGVRRERREIKAVRRGGKYQFPLVVLVNGGSASASEIVSGAMKNRNRGLIIGSQTFGKGSVQQLYDFPDSSSLKLTIGQYLTPGEESIQSVGITPDVKVSPVFADSADEVDLFPNATAREQDLESHLSDNRTQKRKPEKEVRYLSEKLDESELQRRATSSAFHDDFEIRLAHRVLSVTRGPNRPDLLKAAKAVVEQTDAEEDRKIDGSLRKLGLDWSPGETPKAVKLNVQVIDAKPVRAGDELLVTLEATNEGEKPLHRVKGVSISTSNYFSDREFLFGRLAPGESRRWTQKLMIPKDIDTRMDLMRVELTDERKRMLSTVDVPVSIVGLPHPSFAYGHYIDDSAGGNGDGTLQVGESVDLVVMIHNSGNGPAEEPTALLKNMGGPEIFIEKGREQLEKIAPGKTGLARLKFKVQSAAKNLQLRIQVFDGVMGDFLVEKFEIPIVPSTSLRKKSLMLKTTQADVQVRSHASESAGLIGTLEEKAKVVAISETDSFFKVKLGQGAFGFLAKSGVAVTREKPRKIKAGFAKGFSWKFLRDPPRISVRGVSSDTPVVVDGAEYSLELEIQDDDPIHDIYFFVGSEKVFYRRMIQEQNNQVMLKSAVTLEPGVNMITVIAREDGDFSQRKTLSVYSKAGDPLSEKRKISAH